MIDKLEQLKNIMGENDSEIESMYAIILAIAANIIPCTIFIFFYKRIFFLELDFWKLILISVSITSPIFMLNYWITNIQSAMRILSNPKKLAQKATENRNKNRGKKVPSKKRSKEDIDYEVRKVIIDELYTALTTRNKNILYITSKKMIFIFSVTLIGFYYLDLKEYLLQHMVIVFLCIELIFFIIPTISDQIYLKKMIRKEKDK